MYDYSRLYSALRERVKDEILRIQVERDLNFDEARFRVQAEMRPQIIKDYSRLEAEKLLLVARQHVADDVDVRAQARQNLDVAATRFSQRHLLSAEGSALAIALRKAQKELLQAKQTLHVALITQQLLAYVLRRVL